MLTVETDVNGDIVMRSRQCVLDQQQQPHSRDSSDHNWGKLQLSSSHVRQERSSRVMTLSESVISVMTVGFYTFSAAAPAALPWEAVWSFRAGGTDRPSLY